MITTKAGKVKPYKEKKKLRPLAEPFVVAPPGATSSKTRIRTTGEELDAILDIGMFLGSIARQDLVTLLHLEAQGMPNCRAERKQNITATTSSRWAGGITRSSKPGPIRSGYAQPSILPGYPAVPNQNYRTQAYPPARPTKKGEEEGQNRTHRR